MKHIFYTLILICITLGLVELILPLFIELPNPYAHLEVNRFSSGSVIRLQNPRNTDITFLFRPNDLFPEGESVVNDIHINNYGFRHDEDIDSVKKEYRIFAIGGSTTQGYDYLYEKTWCQVLEKGLEKKYNIPINVYNGGTAGAAMFDHIALLQNRAIHLQPDMIILFAGVNDLNLLVGDKNKFRFDDIYEKSESITWFKLLLGKSSIFKLVKNAKENLTKSDLDKGLKERKHRPLPKGIPVQFADQILPSLVTQALPLGTNPEVDFEYYKKMVASFIGTCKANGIPLFIITQPTTWLCNDDALQKYHWMNKNKDSRFDKKFMQASMNKMNDDVAKLAIENNVPIFRAETKIPNDGEYFYDDCHFTPKGSVFMGNMMSDFVLQNDLVKPMISVTK
jgi:lysophospholipase L1-like esterase